MCPFSSNHFSTDLVWLVLLRLENSFNLFKTSRTSVSYCEIKICPFSIFNFLPACWFINFLLYCPTNSSTLSEYSSGNSFIEVYSFPWTSVLFFTNLARNSSSFPLSSIHSNKSYILGLWFIRDVQNGISSKGIQPHCNRKPDNFLFPPLCWLCGCLSKQYWFFKILLFIWNSKYFRIFEPGLFSWTNILISSSILKI